MRKSIFPVPFRKALDDDDQFVTYSPHIQITKTHNLTTETSILHLFNETVAEFWQAITYYPLAQTCTGCSMLAFPSLV